MNSGYKTAYRTTRKSDPDVLFHLAVAPNSEEAWPLRKALIESVGVFVWLPLRPDIVMTASFEGLRITFRASVAVSVLFALWDGVL